MWDFYPNLRAQLAEDGTGYAFFTRDSGVFLGMVPKAQMATMLAALPDIVSEDQAEPADTTTGTEGATTTATNATAAPADAGTTTATVDTTAPADATATTTTTTTATTDVPADAGATATTTTTNP